MPEAREASVGLEMRVAGRHYHGMTYSVKLRADGRRLTRALLNTGLVLTWMAVPDPTLGQISKGPYIQQPAADCVSIMWESPTNGLGEVRFGAGDRLNKKIKRVAPRVFTSFASTADSGPTKTSTLRTFYLYEAALKNLKPGTAYSYEVRVGETRTERRQFRTYDPRAERVRFIAYGDTRSTPSIHAGLASQFARYAPDLILHTGDLVARGEDYDLWSREFFTPLAGVIDHVALFSVIGNHEHDGTNYLNYFHLPGNELWYSLDAGPVHVLALDFRFPGSTNEQYAFARRDLLSSKAPWKVVITHEPVFNIGGHASAWGQHSYLPLFYEAKVDLVLAGHSHMYERFRPIARTGGGNGWAIEHITTGGGGANLHTAMKHPALETQETTNHFMVFDVSRDTLKAQAVRADGSVLDQFELRKTGGVQPKEYLARAYPEELLKLFYEIRPGLAGRAADVPAVERPAEVMLTLAPRQAPAEVQIGLVAESAASYELVNGPARATTLTDGRTNTVWVKVRARPGKNVALNRSKEITPPLVFQAEVKAAEGETVAYGVNTRISKTAQEAAEREKSEGRDPKAGR